MPVIRAYPPVTSLEPTDAFVIDRIGTGTEYVEYQYLIPAPTVYPLNIAFEYLGGIIPASLEVMGALIWPIAATIPANFVGSYGAIITNPTASFVITVNHNGSSVGTITVSTGGVYTFATTSGNPIVFAAGDTLTFVAPSSVDATAEDFFFTIVATRD